MPSVRLLLAWIVMFAIPVQGIAAASMLFCGPGAHHATAAAVKHEHQHEHAPGVAAHGHAQHQADAQPAHDAAAGASGDGPTVADLMHKCSVCAAHCHAVAMPQTPLVFLADEPGRADPGEPLLAAYSRPLRVPDKPPRA
jgi:hypothetical protein